MAQENNTGKTDNAGIQKNADSLFATFFLENQEFAIDVRKVREAIELTMTIIPIPNSIDIVKGIINLRGEIIPIIDLKLRFQMDSPYKTDCRVAIVKCKNRYFGLLFDNISEVLRIKTDTVKTVETDPENKNTSIQGLINLGDESNERIIQIFNPDLLFEKYDLPLIANQSEDLPDGQDYFAERAIIERKQIITYLIAGQEYGIDVADIREIIKIPTIRKRIDVADYIKGIIVIRGQIISLVDLRLYMGYEEKTTDSDSRILILSGPNACGFIVDAIKEVITFDKKETLPMPQLSETGLKDFFYGVLQHSKNSTARNIILCDAKKLFTPEEREQIEGNVFLHAENDKELKKIKKSFTGDDSLSAIENETRVFITFKLDDIYGVDILRLQEILTGNTNIIHVPGQFDAFKGILNLRGTILPIINLRTFFQLEPIDTDSEKILLLNSSARSRAGFIVDDILEIVTIDIDENVHEYKMYGMEKNEKFKEVVKQAMTVYGKDGEQKTILVFNVDAFLDALDIEKKMKGLKHMENIENIENMENMENMGNMGNMETASSPTADEEVI